MLAFYGTKAVVSELTPSNHIAYEKHCREKFKHMASTINRRRHVLMAALDHAKRNGVLPRATRAEAADTRPEGRWLSRDERRG